MDVLYSKLIFPFSLIVILHIGLHLSSKNFTVRLRVIDVIILIIILGTRSIELCSWLLFCVGVEHGYNAISFDLMVPKDEIGMSKAISSSSFNMLGSAPRQSQQCQLVMVVFLSYEWVCTNPEAAAECANFSFFSCALRQNFKLTR